MFWIITFFVQRSEIEPRQNEISSSQRRNQEHCNIYQEALDKKSLRPSTIFEKSSTLDIVGFLIWVDLNSLTSLIGLLSSPDTRFDKQNVLTFKILPNTRYLSGGLELKDVYWTYTLIKAKHYLIDFCWKFEYDAKTSGWVGQDLSVLVTLSVGRIDMWLTPKYNIFNPLMPGGNKKVTHT